MFAIAAMFLKIGLIYIAQSDKHSDMLVTLLDEWRLPGAILCMILILTQFIEKYFASLCQRRHSMYA